MERAYRVLGSLSRVLNRLAKGKSGQTLCARIAASHGTDCLFCRLVALATSPDHCADELARWNRRGTSAAMRLRQR
ncbi:hypothetical protein [Pseudaminobacter sp. NGMCC 1.201702]|uniref:hypothetical protein n=1 Tax=Pseudaminobacter sp. NGMCC 1.201702 TaxID=3391825 RepID=UPI0039EF4238